MPSDRIYFNKPPKTEKSLKYILESIENGRISGDGYFTEQCHKWIERTTGTSKALLTHSCTAALEMAAILVNAGPGDEIIMPSYTFASTANAFALRGAIPVFVDVRADTMNLDERLIEDAITPATKAICVVHYAGVACEMDSIMALAKRHGLAVVEDAAQAHHASYRGQQLGTFGALGTLSFHETKNIVSGEGGALLINDPALLKRAMIIREKGTNRTEFLNGQIDKYTWMDIGSSYLPSEMIAAFLLAQLESGEDLITRRLAIWNTYNDSLASLEQRGLLRRPGVPDDCAHNGHIYYLLTETHEQQRDLRNWLKQHEIDTATHYVPLHSSPAGMRFGRAHGDLPVTCDQANRLVRLPVWSDLPEAATLRVCDRIHEFFGQAPRAA